MRLYCSVECKDSTCDYKAFTKVEATTHYERIHLKLKKYSCDLCTYLGYNKSDVKDHTKNIHKNI